MNNRWFQVAIILLVTTVAYLPIFTNGFVIDDHVFVQHQSDGAGFVGGYHPTIVEAFRGAVPPGHEGVYRPIRGVIYTLYFNLFGTNPFFYHLHSLLVHLAATVLVYLIVSVIARSRDPSLSLRAAAKQSHNDSSGQAPQSHTNVGSLRRPNGLAMTAFIAALLFGLHPVHTESITYIASSMDMTGVVFMLGAFWLYVRSLRHPNGLAMTISVILALLGFFTYEMTITLPLLLVLYEWIFRVSSVIPVYTGIQRKKDWIPAFAGMTQRVWPYFAGAAGFFVVRFALGVGLGRGEYLAYSFFHTQLTMIKMWVKYLGLLVWPVTLSHNHTVVQGFEAFMTPYSDQAAILSQTILDPEILLSIGVIGAIGVIGWKMRKKHPLVSFCVGWFFISMLPVAYIFPQGTAIAEKYLYIASVGWVMAFSYIFVKLVQLDKLDKWVAIGVIGVVALLYGVRTVARNHDWRSPRTLWEYEARIHPESELAYYNLGIIYGEAGEREKAVAAYTKALQLEPRFSEARHNLERINTNTTNKQYYPLRLSEASQ